MAWADRSPTEQVDIGYCAPRGIPLSVFTGRVVYPGDPQWMDEDREAVYDWLVHQAGLCSDCGQLLEECMAKDNSFAYRAEAVRCHSCWAIANESARLAKGKPSATAGHRYKVKLVEAN